MKITNQKELDKLIATADKSNTIVLNEDLQITFDCEIPCSINAYNIEAYNIETYNIETYNIDAHNIYARNIYARNIDAHNIDAHNIYARNIYARNIDANNIWYYALCIAYQSFKCKSISGKINNSLHKCLDQEIEIIKEEEKVTIELTKEQLTKIKHLII